MPFPRAKKSFGQHFLADQGVLRDILLAANVLPGETVLEIGPGTGVLTKTLLETRARIIAVEADSDLVPALKEISQLDLIFGDILALRGQDPTLGGRLKDEKYAVVANIPYNITSELLRDCLTRTPRPSRLILMVQREVADRITAKPPDMSLLSVMCQLYANVKKVRLVSRGAFSPPPKVDSAVITLRLKNEPPLLPKEGLGVVFERESIVRLARDGFAAPRKQLAGNLAAAKRGAVADIKQHLLTIGLRSDIRAEGLTPDDWIKLFIQLEHQ